MEKLNKIDPYTLNESIFKLIGKDWMLVSAGTPGNFNMMTASWGTCGILWNKPIAMAFIRPQRYTYQFVEKHDVFSLSFFDESFRSTLNVLGTQSGRDMDKMNMDKLTPMETPSGSVAFEEARLVLECRKIYYDDIKPALFLDEGIHKMYPSEDYHRFYIGEIMEVMGNFH